MITSLEKDMVTEEEVKQFIRKFSAVMAERGLRIVPRRKNIIEGYLSGWLPFEVQEFISSLEPEDYVEGPMKNHDKTEGEVWVFAKMAEHILMYIKLKLGTEAKCLSFHPCDYRPVRPFGK
jgi:hypothetical protein